MTQQPNTQIVYPDGWLGKESIGLIINYGELTRLVKANGLNSGHLTVLAFNIQNIVLSDVNKMLAEQLTKENN